MGIQDNKAIVEKFFDLMNQTDEDKLLALLTEDFTFESMLQKPEAFCVTWNSEQFAAVPANMSKLMIEPLKIWVVSLTAEEDRVAAEAQSHGEMKNGKTYDNAYHFLFKLRDGKIYNAREYSCSFTAFECLGDLMAGNNE